MGYLVQAKAALYLFEGPFIFSLCICLSYPASQHLVKSPQSIIVSYFFLSNESRKCRVRSLSISTEIILSSDIIYNTSSTPHSCGQSVSFSHQNSGLIIRNFPKYNISTPRRHNFLLSNHSPGQGSPQNHS